MKLFQRSLFVESDFPRRIQAALRLHDLPLFTRHPRHERPHHPITQWVWHQVWHPQSQRRLRPRLWPSDHGRGNSRVGTDILAAATALVSPSQQRGECSGGWWSCAVLLDIPSGRGHVPAVAAASSAVVRGARGGARLTAGRHIIDGVYAGDGAEEEPRVWGWHGGASRGTNNRRDSAIIHTK